MVTSNTTEDRSATYRLLSCCYYPPDERLVEALRESDVRALRQITVPTLDKLKVDYAQLFVGPFDVAAPPYGSVYLEHDRRICGDTTMDIIARYREEGLQVTLKEPADHVAVELEYMYLLALRQMQASAEHHEGLATRYMQKQRDFLQTHLGVWVVMFTQRIVEHARTGFYRHVAAATDAFVSRDCDLVSGRTTPTVCRAGAHGNVEPRAV